MSNEYQRRLALHSMEQYPLLLLRKQYFQSEHFEMESRRRIQLNVKEATFEQQFHMLKVSIFHSDLKNIVVY
ncbi:hypothetical protein BLA29_008316 [Euroglyphus maynei]|uniref:Uncharacterized protein n=1 Tax=Euroglyphus maynei TaxID=6958 RepID=A0A1Y3B0R5_EURMA|nr:hypothetical protein BLA29_008316 [Euroglyphus maynei]